MRLQLLTFLLLASFTSRFLAQTCPVGTVTFNSQQEVTDFLANYPSCTELENVNILGSDINDLTPLNNIIYTGTFFIQQSNGPSRIDGLMGLQKTDDFVIISQNLREIPLMNNLDSINGMFAYVDSFDFTSFNLNHIGSGFTLSLNSSFNHGPLSCLSNITSISGDLDIAGYNASSLSGLENLNEIQGSLRLTSCEFTQLTGLSSLTSITQSFSLNNCDQLNDLDGLSALTFIGGDLNINPTYSSGGNDNLQNLNGLENLTKIGGALRIVANPNLTSLSGISSLDTIGNGLYLGINSSFPGNISLSDISTLSNLKHIGNSIYVYGNQSLNSLVGLEGIKKVNGFLWIEGNNLQDLTPLSSVDTVTSSLRIQNEAIQSISSFNSLKHVGSALTVSNNPNLNTINGFDSLSTVTYGVFVSFNPQLNSISGFPDLQSITQGPLYMHENLNLNDISGIMNLQSTGYFHLVGSPSLNDLSNFSTLNSINGHITLGELGISDLIGMENIDPTGIYSNNSNIAAINISFNSNLSDCAVQGICDAFDIPTITWDIHDNAPGCNSVIEVESACNALPLSWTMNLTSKANRNSISLEWSVSNQINNDYFQIEKGNDGIQFEPIGRINGEVNFTSEKQYSFVDEEPFLVKNYYRIKQLDLSGSFSYSNIAVTNFSEAETTFNMYPNPAKDELFLHKENLKEVQIYNSIGELIHTYTFSQDIGRIDISTIGNGIYFISIGGIEMQKLVIQR